MKRLVWSLGSLLTVTVAVPSLIMAETPENMKGVANVAYAHSQYMLHCQGCHLPDGSGFPGRIPRLTDFVGNFLHIEGGREFLVQVPGSSSAPMDNETLAQVLNWILVTFSEKQLPKDYQPYTEEEVAKLRQHPLLEVEKYREKLLNQIAK